MSQDQLIPIMPEGEENTEEIRQLQVEDEENTRKKEKKKKLEVQKVFVLFFSKDIVLVAILQSTRVR